MHGFGERRSLSLRYTTAVPKPSERVPTHPVKPISAAVAKQLKRVRKVCLAMPGAEEKLSHGEPTFFCGKVFAMFDNNHHNTGHIAIWIPAAPGLQESLVEEAPETYFRPPYVGCKGWVGIELARVTDDVLAAQVQQAWRLVAPRKLVAASLSKF